MVPFRSYVFSDRETENSKKFSGQRIFSEMFSRIFSPKIILENFTSLLGTCQRALLFGNRRTLDIKLLSLFLSL
jgi:hypothetical protein